jgi:hypothetical protein
MAVLRQHRVACGCQLAGCLVVSLHVHVHPELVSAVLTVQELAVNLLIQ